MPARSSLSPGTLPFGFALLRFLPQRKVVVGSFLGTASRQRPFPISLQFDISYGVGLQLRVMMFLGEGKGIEVDGAIGFVGVAVGHDALDEGDDGGDVFADAGEDIGRLNLFGCLRGEEIDSKSGQWRGKRREEKRRGMNQQLMVDS